MESSTVLAFRIFVMLSCLIIVPLAAIFGSAFPDVVKTVLVDRIVALANGKPVESATTTAAGVAPPAVAEGAPGATPWEAPRWPAQSEQAPAGQNLATPAAPSGVMPASATGTPMSGGNQPAAYAAMPDANNGAPGYPLQQAGGQMPAAAANAPATPGYPAYPPVGTPTDAAATGAPRPLDQADPFTTMERKLREYGATYYLLETWGTSGDLYRFHCRMAVSNNPNYTRHFEATDRDALQAMSQVLSRVEAWRSGRVQ